MKKKVIYKVTDKYAIEVEVKNKYEEQVVKDLNKNLENSERQNRRKKCVSLDYLYESVGFEVKDKSLSSEELYEKQMMYKKIHEAIETLTEKQKKVIHMYFWENKTIREIALELGVYFTTVEESYQAALKKIRKYFNKF